jgi:hypothetical protein
MHTVSCQQGAGEEDAKMNTDKIVTMRVRAFAGEGAKSHDLLVEPDGSVLVWDTVGAHYTRCHSLTSSAQKRAIKLAAERGLDY